MSIGGAGVTGNFYNFRGNSVFDPDQTATGGQPAYFDDYAFVYDRYRVWGSRINVTPQQGTTSGQNQLLIVPATTTSTATTLTQAQNLQANRFSVHFAFSANTSQFRPGGFWRQMSTQRMFGATPQSFLGNPNYHSAITTNPADQWYWNILTFCPAQDQATTLVCSVVVEYDVEFFQRVSTTLDLDGRFLRLLNIRKCKKESDDKDGEEKLGRKVREVGNDLSAPSVGEGGANGSRLRVGVDEKKESKSPVDDEDYGDFGPPYSIGPLGLTDGVGSIFP